MTVLVEVKEPSTQFLRVAERHRSTPQEIAALYLDDLGLGLGVSKVFFRASGNGREAMIRGTGLTVWELVKLVHAFEGDEAAAAAHLEIDESLVREARTYAAQRPREIEEAIRESESITLDHLKAALPNLHIFNVSDNN